MRGKYFLLRRHVMVLVFLCFFCTPLAKAAPVDSFEAWTGIYRFDEVQAERYTWVHEITIYQEGGAHYAKIVVDGTQTCIRLLAKVVNDNSGISLIFEKYLPDNMFEPYNVGDLLLRFELKGAQLITEWGAFTPINIAYRKSGIYFVKWADQSAVAIPNNGQYAWFGFDSVFLGGFVSGKWRSAEDLLSDDKYSQERIQKGDVCNVYSSKGLLGPGTVAAVYSELLGQTDPDFRGPDTDRFDVRMKDGSTLGWDSVLLAIKCPWNPVPRQALVMSPDNTTYKDIVRKYLARNGLPNSAPNIMQLFKIDLEGDGVDEVIICAQNIVGQDVKTIMWAQDKQLGTTIPGGSYKGNYSLLLLRKIVNGQVREIPIGQFLATKDATPVNDEWIPPALYKICQFADLNGDGILEIIVAINYYESYAYVVYEIKGDKVVQVLANGAGS